LSLTGKLEARLDVELGRTFSYEPNRKFAKHLRKHRDQIFTFLRLRLCVEFEGELEATNWPAEQAIRPAVINRKTSGGNRTAAGAKTQAVLTSIFRTCKQRDVDPIEFLVGLLRAVDREQYSAEALGP